MTSLAGSWNTALQINNLEALIRQGSSPSLPFIKLFVQNTTQDQTDYRIQINSSGTFSVDEWVCTVAGFQNDSNPGGGDCRSAWCFEQGGTWWLQYVRGSTGSDQVQILAIKKSAFISVY